MSAPALEKMECFAVHLRNGDAWIRLAIQLGEEFTGGEVVRLAPEGDFSIEPNDDLSSSYGRSNWFSGLSSGAFYAFRVLKLPRRVLWVTNFTGKLGSSDMSAVAEAAFRTVAGCFHHDAPPIESAGWQSVEPPANGAVA